MKGPAYSEKEKNKKIKIMYDLIRPLSRQTLNSG